MPIVPLTGLLGQPDVTAFLRGIVSRARYGNAYLFTGPAGVGKGTAALAFARAALCDRVPGAAPPAAANAEDDGLGLFGEIPAAAAQPVAEQNLPLLDDACGECPACRKSGSLQHPDLKFLFPVSGVEAKLEETISETLQGMRDDPLFVFQYDQAASVRLSLTRELQRELAFRPYEASRRVVIIRDCDRMREDQYSALLKSIEEPGASTLWVLTSSRISRVPATIRSRCQTVKFAPLPERAVEQVLEQYGKASGPLARTLAALASGSLARAVALSREDAAGQARAALAMLEPVRARNQAGLWKAAQDATKFGRAGREALRRTLEFHELWLRDLLAARYGDGSRPLVFAEREAEIRAEAAKTDAAEIRRRLMVLEEALRSIDGNITADLTLFSALARVGGARLGEGAWPAHQTARWDY